MLTPEKLIEAEGRLHASPSFLIIGVQKGGTTSLFQHMMRHPQIRHPVDKELDYFDKKYNANLGWYKKCFPFKSDMKTGEITGEASTDYLINIRVPERVFKVFPEIKIIALLRNPVERAYSHFQHNKRLKFEKLPSFEMALKEEEHRIDRNYEFGHNHTVFTYKTKGYYATHLKRWFQYFDRKQFLIIESQNLFNNTPQVMLSVCDFLGIQKYNKDNYERYNFWGRYPDMKNSTREMLVQHFTPHNEELYNLLNTNFGWK